MGEVCVLKCVGTQVPCRVGVLVAAAAPEAVTAVANRLDPATGQKSAQRRKNNHGSSCDGELLSDNDQHATTSTTIKNQHSREGACQLCLPCVCVSVCDSLSVRLLGVLRLRDVRET